jgi:hypothetical protein
VDAYSLACIRLALFLPLTCLLTLDLDKAAELAAVIAVHFPVPAGYLTEAVREITGAAEPRATGRSARDQTALSRAIVASATPSRSDRLFPGDIEQFAAGGGGLAIAHGAAGVLYALSRAAGLRFPDHEEWLLDRVADPARGSRLGRSSARAAPASRAWPG